MSKREARTGAEDNLEPIGSDAEESGKSVIEPVDMKPDSIEEYDGGKQIWIYKQFPVMWVKNGFGNPRKIKKKKVEELKRSLDTFGDFGCIIIDESLNVIAGNQRVTILKEINPDATVLAKRLIGYTESEKRAINIKDNTHSGEWDLDLLSDWTADLNLDLGLDNVEKDPDERKIKEMEPINYEKYNYVLIVCKSELDFNNLSRKLGIDNAVVKISDKKKIKARAVWYDQTGL